MVAVLAEGVVGGGGVANSKNIKTHGILYFSCFMGMEKRKFYQRRLTLLFFSAAALYVFLMAAATSAWRGTTSGPVTRSRPPWTSDIRPET
jgi:hypothetical protein